MSKNKKISRAGFIPYLYRDGQLVMMFMKPSNAKYGGSDFQIAKGKVEDGETAEQAALRESSEELGLREKNVKNVQYLGLFLGYTDIFYGEMYNMENFGDTTYETSETTWMTPEEFRSNGRTLHIPIIKAFLRQVNYG